MTLLDACLAGLAGAGAIEVAELYSATRKVRNFPWRVEGECPLAVYLFSVVLRLALGAFAAWFCARTGPLDTAGAAAAGIAAPKLLEQLGRAQAPAALPSPATRTTRKLRALPADAIPVTANASASAAPSEGGLTDGTSTIS